MVANLKIGEAEHAGNGQQTKHHLWKEMQMKKI